MNDKNPNDYSFPLGAESGRYANRLQDQANTRDPLRDLRDRINAAYETLTNLPSGSRIESPRMLDPKLDKFRVISEVNLPLLEAKMNTAADQGFIELVQITPASPFWVAVLRRPDPPLTIQEKL